MNKEEAETEQEPPHEEQKDTDEGFEYVTSTTKEYQPDKEQQERLPKLLNHHAKPQWSATIFSKRQRILDTEESYATPYKATIVTLLGGERIKAPSNGNCQPYALVETLTQQLVIDFDHQEIAAELTICIKATEDTTTIQNAHGKSYL